MKLIDKILHFFTTYDKILMQERILVSLVVVIGVFECAEGRKEMRWIMRKDFEIAYAKADEVLAKIRYSSKEMIRTASIIDAVEEILHIDVKFTEYDFSRIPTKNKSIDISNFGAAMCVSDHDGKTYATILLNEKETSKMQRFSLVHELGHLMTQPSEAFKEYQVSTHIDMDITSIPDEVLNATENKFLINEQVANIFALLVLIPFDMLLKAMTKYDSLDKIAEFFGVEKNAVISRLRLEDARKLVDG